eukprot:13060180-Alexandrium_andersonii.AAC.1
MLQRYKSREDLAAGLFDSRINESDSDQQLLNKWGNLANLLQIAIKALVDSELRQLLSKRSFSNVARAFADLLQEQPAPEPGAD